MMESIKQQTEVLKKYKGFGGWYRFDGLSPDVALKLCTGWPNIDPYAQQSEKAPTGKEIIDIAERHGGTLEGYVIETVTHREDARIMLDGFTIACTPRERDTLLKKFGKEFRPEEIELKKDGSFRCWWD